MLNRIFVISKWVTYREHLPIFYLHKPHNLFSELSKWAGWSSCSVSCGGGTRTRTRTCILGCTDLLTSYTTNTEACNNMICEFLVQSTGYGAVLNGISLYTFSGPPEFSPWGSWSSCNQGCGNGEKTRTRSCTANCNALRTEDTAVTTHCTEGECKFTLFR